MAEPGPNVVLVAFAKNEGRFLLEWIAYHRLIGVADILVYTNDCEDESPALLDRMQQMGLAIHIPNPVPPGGLPQNQALNRAQSHPLVLAADYVLQIDVDEFVCIKAGQGRISDLIAAAPEADVICLQMRFFGDNGLARLGDGLVIEQLTRASPADDDLNAFVKSLARNGPMFRRVTANHMPVLADPPAPAARVFNGGGVEVPPQAYGGARFKRMPDGFGSMLHVQLNHYAVRTFADYCAKKRRGTPAGHDEKLTLAYWKQRNRNDEPDDSILRHAAATRALMAQWLRDPVLADRDRRCRAAYEDILARSADAFGDRRAAPARRRRS